MGQHRGSKVHHLVLFNQKEEVVRKEEKKPNLIFESVEKEDNIKVIYELKPVGSYYRYSLMIINSNITPITDIKINITFPEFMQLYRCSPSNLVPDTSIDDQNACKIFLEQLAGNAHTQANLYLTPSSLSNKGVIKTFVTFVNSNDFVRVLNSEPLEISIPDLTLEPQIIPSVKINEIYQDTSYKRALVSLGIKIENKVDYSNVLNHLEMVLKFNKLQLITRDMVNKVLWFYGRAWNKEKFESAEKFNILVVCQIVSDKMEFLICCKNPSHLVGVSTLIIKETKERLLRSNIISSKTQVIRLDCKNCGVALPSFPKKDEEIACKSCKVKQKIW
ncbi:MAG: hypothetical protein JW891_11930 [Candidatus Lokiarchaeota archaeon]|nr:hypothetical protein [Candidatus Lokiarchaeota archaeon]